MKVVCDVSLLYLPGPMADTALTLNLYTAPVINLGNVLDLECPFTVFVRHFSLGGGVK